MARFGRVAPTIPVRNIDRALGFYRDVLGFEVSFTNGAPISFSAIKQGQAELHLRVDPGRASATHVHLMVDNLDDVYQALNQAGAKILQPPMLQPWGLRDLVVIDPDGNSFEIAESVSDSKSE